MLSRPSRSYLLLLAPLYFHILVAMVICHAVNTVLVNYVLYSPLEVYQVSDLHLFVQAVTYLCLLATTTPAPTKCRTLCCLHSVPFHFCSHRCVNYNYCTVGLVLSKQFCRRYWLSILILWQNKHIFANSVITLKGSMLAFAHF